MSSSKPSSGSRVVHQDYLASVRYANTLPPPSIPAKLLDISRTGLDNGYYTSPSFASAIARQQPLNIEADAELGMPIDLVGMPGVFDGDETSISAPNNPLPIHPRDRPLLMALNDMGKRKTNDVQVSFLRRTEYVTSVSRQRNPLIDNKNSAIKRFEKRKVRVEADDSPAAIRRKIDKSFEFAESYRKNPHTVKHPENRSGIKLVDSFPILPDLDAFPDSGAYVTIKFLTNPVPPSNQYDSRLLNGLLKPVDTSPAEEAMYHAAVEAYERDPKNHSKPPPMMNYDLFINQKADHARKFRARFDVDNPEKDDEELYTHNFGNGPCFRFERLRGYETVKEVELNHTTKYESELLVTFTNGDDEHQKAMWYYPVMQRSHIRPQRQRRLDIQRGFTQEEREDLDALDVRLEEPTDEVRGAMMLYYEKPYGPEAAPEVEYEEAPGDVTQNIDDVNDAEGEAE